MGMAATVFVVDDDTAVRESLRWLIESTDMRVETYCSAEQFLSNFDPRQPGCLLLDVRMPNIDGLTLQEELRNRGINIPIIIITGHADVSMAIKAMKAGAVDFIEKPFSDEALLRSIRFATREDTRIRMRTTERNEARDRVRRLTRRERQVLGMVAEGHSSKIIASKLGVALKTVESHRANLKRKMQAETLADLIRLAIIGKVEAKSSSSIPIADTPLV